MSAPALEALAYEDRGTALTGWLARPVGTAKAAVLVFPTIANVTPAIERRAAMLADLGYLALIADFYGEQPPSFEASRPLAEALRANVDHYRARLSAGLEALAALPEAQGLPRAAIGYCMGGQAALELVREGADLAAAVSFHGVFTTGRKASADKPFAGRVLVCHGDADPMAPRDHVLALWEELDAAGVSWHFHAYSGVKHGFTDPGSDARGLPAIAYDAAADRSSWAAMTELFAELFD
jgi:dienelactone hydrolase